MKLRAARFGTAIHLAGLIETYWDVNKQGMNNGRLELEFDRKNREVMLKMNGEVTLVGDANTAQVWPLLEKVDGKSSATA